VIRAFRIVKSRLANEALSGNGARIYGGRWNSPGRAAIYAASSLSLALLEIMVHLENWAALRSGWSYLELRFPAACLEQPAPGGRPKDVRAASSTRTARLGDVWLAAGTALALAVPSAVVPDEKNYLINPAHPDMTRLAVGTPHPLDADPRLLR